MDTAAIADPRRAAQELSEGELMGRNEESGCDKKDVMSQRK